jgi:type III secretion system HrpE/YscL family protein
MSSGFTLWHRDPAACLGIASDRRVLRAAEVPALQQAQQLVDELQSRLAQEEARIAAAAERAAAEGLREGLAQAEAQSRAQVADEIARLARAHEDERRRLQQGVATLALEVFQKLLGELPAEGRLARLAQQAARELLPARCWRLHVHPGDAAGLRAALRTLDPDDPTGLASAEVVTDAELAPGDCRLVTEFGTADAGLATQVERLARAWGLRP